MRGDVDDLVFELGAGIARRPPGLLLAAEGRIRDRAREVARQVAPDLENIGTNPLGLGQELLADPDIIGIDFNAGDARSGVSSPC